jgi:tyrosine-protein kinase Etk/Wzc
MTAYLVYTEVPRYRAAAVMRLVDARGAMTGGIADAAAGPLMGRSTDPVQSQLLVLKGRPLLGEVVDREGLRLLSLSPRFPVGRLRDVRVALPHDAGDTVRLRFGAQGVEGRMRDREARAAYGQPLVLNGVSFTVPTRPEDEEDATLAVMSREDAIDWLFEDLRAAPRENTDGIDVEFTSTDPEIAKRVVNTAAQLFQSANARAAQQQAVRRRTFLEQQLRETDAEMAQAQARLSGFRSREQVYSSRERLSAQQEAMTQVEMRREELDSERRIFQSLLNQLEGGRGAITADGVRALMSAPGVATNPAIAEHFKQLMEYQSALDSLTTSEWRRSETHPDVQRLRTRMASTEARLVNAVRGQVSTLGTRVAALDQMRARSGTEISQLPQSEAEEVRLTQQVQSIQRLGDQLREEYQRARISEAVEAGQVEIVNSASRAEPVPSRRPLKLALGLMLGLMLGSGGAFLVEHMNTSIRRREDIETVLHLPGLGVIPRIAPTRKGLRGAALNALPSGNGGPSRDNGNGTHASGLIMTHSARSPGAEAFRTIRTNLVFSQAVQTLKTLVVTSTSPGEGKTTTAANLAATFAQQQARVLLMDCDLRRPKLDQMFGVPREPGLTNVLLGQGTTQDTIRSTGVENLHVLTAGILPPNPYELLGGERMTRLLDILSDEYDMLVIDTAPLMAASDAAVLGAKADGVLLVVRAGSTDRGAAQQATQQLAAVGARVIGAVLNDPDATAEQYGGYYYDYSYSEKT